jgi:hypothetical protein
VLTIPGEDGAGNFMCKAIPVKVAGRRELLERNKEGEYGKLRVALLYDLMLNILPDPIAILEWEEFKSEKEKQVCAKV